MLSGALSFYLVQLVSVAVLSGLQALQMWIVFGLTSLYVLAIFVLDAGQVGFWPIAMLVLMVSLLVITTTAMDFSQRVVFRRKLKLKQLNQFHEGEIDTFSVDALSNWVASANESTMEEGTNGHKSESLLLFQVEAEEVEILDKIGAGGAGMVFKGRYCHHKVAVKQIYAAAFSGSSDREVAWPSSCCLSWASVINSLGLLSGTGGVLEGSDCIKEASPSVHHWILWYLQDGGRGRCQH